MKIDDTSITISVNMLYKCTYEHRVTIPFDSDLFITVVSRLFLKFFFCSSPRLHNI